MAALMSSSVMGSSSRRVVGKRRKKPDLPTGLPCKICLANGRELSGALRGLRRARRHPILQAKNRSSGGDLGGPGNPWVAAGLIAGMPVDVAIGHPWLGLYPSQPVRHARNAALAVFTDMLLADPAHGNVPTRAIGQGQAEDTFGLEQALGMVTQGSVREEREVLFRGIEPVMYGLIVRRHPAEFPGRAFGMMKRMGHLRDPRHSCASIRHSDPHDRG